MTKRLFDWCAALAIAVLVAVSLSGPASAGSKLQIFYIGGWDCPPCNHWQVREKPNWKASPARGFMARDHSL